MNRKIMALAAAGLLTISLSACAKNVAAGGSTPSDSASASASPSMSAAVTATPAATGADKASGDSFTGVVTKIDGSLITLTVRSGKPSGQKNPGGGAPDSAASSAVPSGGPNGAAPGSGAAPSGAPTGAAPSGNGQSPDSGAAGETKTITVSSSTVVTLEKSDSQTTASVSDIAVGDVIKVTMNGDAVEAITVLSMDGTFGAPGGGGPAGKAAGGAPQGNSAGDGSSASNG